MLTCKSVSKALAESDYEDLPPFKKLALKVHVRFCFVCGRYNRQLMQMQDTCRHFRETSEMQGDAVEEILSEDKKAKMEQLLKSKIQSK